MTERETGLMGPSLDGLAELHQRAATSNRAGYSIRFYVSTYDNRFDMRWLSDKMHEIIEEHFRKRGVAAFGPIEIANVTDAEKPGRRTS